MGRCCRIPVRFLALIAIFCSSVFARDKWLEIRSPHFHVITDAGEKRGREVALRCEQMRLAFQKLMSRAAVNAPAPLLIFALKDGSEVDSLIGSHRQVRHSGLFLPGTDASYILFDSSGDPWRTLFHEYSHALLYANISAATQTWFEEGFAEYFSTLEYDHGRPQVGRVPLAELQFLRANGKLMRLSDLVQVNQDSRLYNQNGPAQAIFYAQSWLLVHYLFDHQLISRAEAFFDLIASGVSLDKAFPQAFGISTQNMEDELLLYARGERFRFFSLPAVADPATAEVAVEQLTEAESAAQKLELRWHSRTEHSKSEAEVFVSEYRELLSHEPGNVTALRGLGLALLNIGDLDAAFDNVLKAVRARPQEAINHLALANVLNILESAHVRPLRDYSTEREAATCAALDPQFADAYRLLSAAAARREDSSAAILMMRKAVALSPRNESYKLDLANLELRQRDYTPAVALLQQLKNSHDPEIARKAELFLSSDIEGMGPGAN